MKYFNIRFYIYSFVIILLSQLPLSPAWGETVVNAFVSILPQKYFVKKIGGSLVKISVLVPVGASPHNYEPKPRQMEALTKTSVYFSIGINIEDIWLKKIAALNQNLIIVPTDENIIKLPMVTYDHNEDDGHSDHDKHGISDPHIWLSPSLAKIQAKNILKGLIKADPDNKEYYSDNYQILIKELDTLDSIFRTIFKGKEGMEFIVYHPSWGYFANDYGLKQIPIEISGKEPKPSQIKNLIEYARNRGIKIIFAQPQSSVKTAKIIAKAIKGQVVIADPLAENWMENLKSQAEKFRAALK